MKSNKLKFTIVLAAIALIAGTAAARPLGDELPFYRDRCDDNIRLPEQHLWLVLAPEQAKPNPHCFRPEGDLRRLELDTDAKTLSR